MQVSESSKKEVEYENLKTLKSSPLYEQVKPLPQPNPPTVYDDPDYDYITISASQAAVGSHGNDPKEFIFTDCAAYKPVGNQFCRIR